MHPSVKDDAELTTICKMIAIVIERHLIVRSQCPTDKYVYDQYITNKITKIDSIRLHLWQNITQITRIRQPSLCIQSIGRNTINLIQLN